MYYHWHIFQHDSWHKNPALKIHLLHFQHPMVRKVAQIIFNYTVLIELNKMCQLVHVSVLAHALK